MYPKAIFMKKEKKELIIFLAVTYGIPFLMTIPMAILFHAGKDVASFPAAQMFYPAAGLMLAKLICEKENPFLPKNFFIGFLILTGLMFLWCFTGFFLDENIKLYGDDYLPIIGTVVVGFLYFSEGEEKRGAYGLTGKNWRISVRILILFVVLTYGSGLLSTFFIEGLPGMGDFLSQVINRDQFLLFVNVPFFVILSMSSFLGEEYGWRTYFQPLLQKKFGLIKGVLLFGVLWEFWHLPLVFFCYSPADPSMSLAQMIVFRYIINILMAIFMAYAYMKTQNVWLPVLIHAVNNGLAGGGLAGGGADVEPVTWMMLGLIVLSRMALFLPFLLAKEFRKPNREERAKNDV